MDLKSAGYPWLLGCIQAVKTSEFIERTLNLEIHVCVCNLVDAVATLMHDAYSYVDEGIELRV